MNLKELREKNKLTQAAFAAPLGVSGKSIYLIESGRMKLSKKLSAKIAEVYGEVIGLSRPNEKQERGQPRQRRRSTRLPRMQRRQFWIPKRKSTRKSGRPGPK